MELFNDSARLSAIILKDYTLLPVINRLGIRLGFGDLTVKELCTKEAIDVNFFTEIINVFHNENYFPEKKLLVFPVTIVIDYLLKTHRYYLDYVIPEQERLIALFMKNCSSGCKENELIRKFYASFKDEFQKHIQFEETSVFPYILNLNNTIQLALRGRSSAVTHGNFTIHGFEKEHGNLDEKMLDLKNIIIKYLPPNYDMNIGNSLLSNIFMFEKDLRNHARIEDKILIPKVKLLESSLQIND